MCTIQLSASSGQRQFPPTGKGDQSPTVKGVGCNVYNSFSVVF